MTLTIALIVALAAGFAMTFAYHDTNGFGFLALSARPQPLKLAELRCGYGARLQTIKPHIWLTRSALRPRRGAGGRPLAGRVGGYCHAGDDVGVAGRVGVGL